MESRSISTNTNQNNSNNPLAEWLLILLWVLAIIIIFAFICIFSGKIIPSVIFSVVLIIFVDQLHFYKNPDKYELDNLQNIIRKRSEEYCNRHYVFAKHNVRINSNFKANLNAYGQWYKIHEPIDSFPSYIADLLKGKHHEWAVLGIEKDGYIEYMWANKGENNSEVSFSCDLGDVISRCKSMGGDAILRFHNHPNSDPSRYTTLVASEQDNISAISCADVVGKEGINWLDFICSQGDFILFYKKISDSYCPSEVDISDYIDRAGISPFLDRELQREYEKEISESATDRKIRRLVTFCLGMAIAISLGVVEYNVRNKLLNDQLGVTVESQEDYINPSEEYIVNTLNNIDGITNVISKRGEYLKGSYYVCSSVVEYHLRDIPQKSSIEVFLDEESAKHRAANLRFGGFNEIYQMGTMVFITSKSIDKSDRNLIKEAFVDNPPTAKEQNQTTEEEIMREVWIITTIDDYEYSYEYTYNDKAIVLDKYQGEARYVIVPSSFEIDGKEFTVKRVGGAFKNNNGIRGVVVSEGVQDIQTNTFEDSKNIECVYLPETLTDNVSYRFIKKMKSIEKVFFGASEVQVKNKYNAYGKKDFEKAISNLKEARFEATEEDCMKAIFE